eukprot:CAMPEP_0167762284 /NCGR_PEP_ID=MMETSP0110_2-20121227/12678_1 /TAXON_ID=629695 /ORGANISM="Gymnochlora sp., Strain CCMP2014" /LENGTH=438 /DNA_ID=CAMNT_0007649133 /DNA_START=120 /DNA_END=1436 /DNA_ORIENTATION=-
MAESVLESPKIGMPPILVADMKGLKLDTNKTAKEALKMQVKKEKKADCIIFVGDLSRTVKEEDLRQVMEKYGSVVNVDIKRDRVTNNNLGYGFVQFSTHKEALKAKQESHGIEVSGRKIRTGWAQRNTSLFVGDLDSFVNANAYRMAFAQHGDLVDDETYFKVEKGFGMVKFKTRESAEAAKTALNGKRIGQSKRPVRVIWGDTSIQKHCVHVKFDVGISGGKEGKNLKDDEMTEEMIQKVFKEFGTVVTVNLPKHSDQSLKGYGFVHFDDSEKGEESAKKAIQNLSGTKIGRLVIQCNYGRKHSKRRLRNGSNANSAGGNNGGSSMRHPSHMYMYQFPPQSGGYPAMMYPMQNPYVYQQQMGRGARPTGPMYPTYPYQQMGYYQYGQAGQGSPQSRSARSSDLQADMGMDYGMDRALYDSHMHVGALHEGMGARLQR